MKGLLPAIKEHRFKPYLASMRENLKLKVFQVHVLAPLPTAMLEVLQTLYAAAEWCAELIEQERQRCPVMSPRRRFSQPEVSRRCDCLHAQMEHINQIEQALNMLSNTSVNVAVQPDSDYCIAIEWVSKVTDSIVMFCCT